MSNTFQVQTGHKVGANATKMVLEKSFKIASALRLCGIIKSLGRTRAVDEKYPALYA